MPQKCIATNCDSTASYNYVGERQRLYCRSHSKSGMTDLLAGPCRYKDCDMPPHYNYPGISYGLFCHTHAEEEMINVHLTCAGQARVNGIPVGEYFW